MGIFIYYLCSYKYSHTVHTVHSLSERTRPSFKQGRSVCRKARCVSGGVWIGTSCFNKEQNKPTIIIRVNLFHASDGMHGKGRGEGMGGGRAK